MTEAEEQCYIDGQTSVIRRMLDEYPELRKRLGIDDSQRELAETKVKVRELWELAFDGLDDFDPDVYTPDTLETIGDEIDEIKSRVKP